MIAAKRLGAEQIIILGPPSPTASRWRASSARPTSSSERGDEAVERVRELTGGFGAHSVLECVGHGAVDGHRARHRASGRRRRPRRRPAGRRRSRRTCATFFDNVTVSGGPAPARAYIEELLPDVLEGTIEPGRVFDRDDRPRRGARRLPRDERPRGDQGDDRALMPLRASHSIRSLRSRASSRSPSRMRSRPTSNAFTSRCGPSTRCWSLWPDRCGYSVPRDRLHEPRHRLVVERDRGVRDLPEREAEDVAVEQVVDVVGRLGVEACVAEPREQAVHVAEARRPDVAPRHEELRAAQRCRRSASCTERALVRIASVQSPRPSGAATPRARGRASRRAGRPCWRRGGRGTSPRSRARRRAGASSAPRRPSSSASSSAALRMRSRLSGIRACWVT